jgi:hypothetical protein
MRSHKVLTNLRKNKLTIHINELNCVKPVRIGFLVNQLIRHDGTEMIKARILAADPSKKIVIQAAPESVHATGINGIDDHAIKVAMISSTSEDAETATKYMRKHFGSNKVSLFIEEKAWNITTTPTQKITTINLQKKYAKVYRSIFLNNIKDINRQVTNENGEVTTIKKFLINLKTAAGLTMFTQVNNPVNHIVEVIVHNTVEQEMWAWTHNYIAYIAQQIQEEDCCKIFLYPDEAIVAREETPEWAPPRISAAHLNMINNNMQKKTKPNPYAKQSMKRTADGKAKATQNDQIPEMISTGPAQKWGNYSAAVKNRNRTANTQESTTGAGHIDSTAKPTTYANATTANVTPNKEIGRNHSYHVNGANSGNQYNNKTTQNTTKQNDNATMATEIITDDSLGATDAISNERADKIESKIASMDDKYKKQHVNHKNAEIAFRLRITKLEKEIDERATQEELRRAIEKETVAREIA